MAILACCDVREVVRRSTIIFKPVNTGLVAACPGTDPGHLNNAWPVSRASTDTVALLWACRMVSQGVLSRSRAEERRPLQMRNEQYAIWL
eukprot:291717-Pleurochrysis_carterae.AAC.1